MRLTLLQRTAISASGLALLVSALLGVGAMIALEIQERSIERTALESGVQELYAHVRAGGWPDLQNDDHTLSAVAQAPDFAAAAPTLRGLKPGLSEIDTGALASFVVLVRDIDGYRYYFGMDMQAAEHQERDFLVIGGLLVVLALTLSIAFGWLFALHQMRPLRALCERVAKLKTSSDGGSISDPRQPRELDQIATAIDEYRHRLTDAQAHQTAFLAAVSHELRTPVAVLQSGVELLCARQSAPDPLLGRLQRNINELSLRLDALMLSARPLVSVPSRVYRVCSEIELAVSKAQIRDHSTLILEIDTTWEAAIRPQVLHWVVVQLLEALAPNNVIALSGTAPTLSIVAADQDAAGAVSAVVQTVCERENWRLRPVAGGFELAFGQ